MGRDDKNPVARALDVFVYGPLGLALYARDTVPRFFDVFVARGRTEVRRRVPSGGTRPAPPSRPAARSVENGTEVNGQEGTEPSLVRQVAPEMVEALAPDAVELAIPDYDELSASQVVARLDGLGDDELAALRAYEDAHRGRRTILYKIDHLTA